MIQGFGLGLRPEHYREFATGEPRVEWLEALSENYMVPGGKPLHFLDRIRAHYPVVLHGVSLSVAGSDPLDYAYLRNLKALAKRCEAAWISDHLCWTGTDGVNLHDLLPFPLTDESFCHVAERVERVQDFLRAPFVIENVSSYLRFSEDEMAEWEFLAALVHRTGCGLLLDVNNVYVNAMNHGFDPARFIEGLPLGAVRQIHLAGHSDEGGFLVDTHDAPVCEDVWHLYERAVRRFGAVPTMIERDDDIPALPVLLEELGRAEQVVSRTLVVAHAHAA